MQYHLPLSCFFHFINKRKIQKQQLSALTAIQMKLDGHHRRLDAITEPQDIDYLYMFLTLGPNENTWSNKGFYFRYVKNSCMLMEDFKRRFTNYMRYRYPQVPKIYFESTEQLCMLFVLCIKCPM